MLLTTLFCYALASQQDSAVPRREAPAGYTLLAIYQKQLVSLERGVKQDVETGKSIRYDRLGNCSWKVMDGGIGGVPCKIYEGSGIWRYVRSIRNTAIKEFHDASFTMIYHVNLDGIPMHSESHFVDQSQRTLETVSVVADYEADHINVKVTKNGVTERLTHFPGFGMERFAGMFEPMMRSGLIQSNDMDCAVVHPYTGVPYEFKLKVRSRFTGSYFSLPQAGYCIEVQGKEGNSTAFLTRQGQLLKVTMPKNLEAFLESGPLYPERKGWGRFSIRDWDKSADETNPERPIYHTLAIPVMFDNPKILFPVPCALTD